MPDIELTSTPRLEAATLEDLPQLTELVMSLLGQEEDFTPNQVKQEHGIRLILEQPSRGRIFVLRTDHSIIGMVNLQFTISTAEGGFVILMEDVIVHPMHRGQGYGTKLLKHALQFATGQEVQAHHVAHRSDQCGKPAILPAERIPAFPHDPHAPGLQG